MSKAFVPGYQHDVFISYAHVDDIPLEGYPPGWVTTLVRDLRTQLARRLGRADNHSVWMDYQLAGNDPIAPTILNDLRQSATLVVFLSQGYLSSPWCRREKDAFLDKIKNLSEQGSPVFVVEIERLVEEEWQAKVKNLADLKSYRFWREDRDSGRVRQLAYPRPLPEDRDYYNLVEDLSHDLAEKLKGLANGSSVPAGDAPAEPAAVQPRASVFLAHVTDDLESRRNEVRRYLEQHAFRVLPEHYYSNDPEPFRQEMSKDLEGCVLFVQLLGQWPGKRPPGAEKGFAHLQHQLAVEKGLPILQWHDPKLDLDEEIDPDQRELLELATVMAAPMEELKARVVEEIERQIKPPQPEPDLPPDYTLVFVNHGNEDCHLAEEVKQVVDKLKMWWSLPLREGRPAELRKDLERNLLESDAIVWLYGQVPEAWVREQLHNYRKIFPQRAHPPRVLGICEGPPPEKGSLGMGLPGLQVINCRDGLNETRLAEFLQRARSGGSA